MHLLVIRTSAMGDVALTTPVITALRKKYPDIEITLVTRPVFAPFFSSIKDLHLFLPDFTGRHKGLFGIIRLSRDLKKYDKIDHVIDLHDVLRSKILRWIISMSGSQVYVIDKGRAEKKQVIKGKNRKRLKHSVERYCDVFAKAGFMVIPETRQSIIPASEAIEKVSGLPLTMSVSNIGVAPYAKHELKSWPEENMIRLLNIISEKNGVKYWLFGGVEDYERLNSLHEKIPGSYLVVGRLNLSEELALMSRLDFMISMDSSNMHMAALSGTKVVSIWGGTDPITGFGAWQEPDEFAIRIPAEELTCRPCTIYGKGKCQRGDFACMNWLTPEKVFEKLINLKII
ncbi:MAG: glycosyltransferase family 9 protein [Bacteroidia bacterium]|nr:glycosyltransferase family 9 protein [Bacteroidia bacterium]